MEYKEDIYILAIESSCDETSIAILKNKELIKQITNTQIDKFKDLGGVVPEMASRMHTTNIFYVYKELFDSVDYTIEDIDAIAVTQGPGLIGSLLVGVNFAKTLSMIYNKPLIGVNHMEAHIYAVELEKEIQYPHLSLIVSGGHTELVYVKSELNFKKIGQTLDDAVGESYDKVARMFNLPYPGGPEIDKLATLGNPNYELPMPKNDGTLDFSFSGLKSACYNFVNTKNMKNETINVEDFAASFQDVVVKTLLNKFDIAYKEFGPRSCSVVGGVSANSKIRKDFLAKYPNLIIPNLKYTTDNAAMVGVIGYHKYLKQDFEEVIDFDGNVELEII